VEVGDRPALPQQPCGGDDLLGGDAGDLGDALGRVLAAQRGVALERGPAVDRALEGDAPHGPEHQRVLDAIGEASGHRVVGRRPSARLIPRHVMGGLARVEVGGGEEPAGVVAHQERAVGPVADELPVVPALADHDAGQAERQRAVGARPHTQPLIRPAGRAGAPRVHDDERRTARLRLGNCGGLGQVGVRGVVAPQQQAAGSLEVGRADVGAEGVGRHEVAVPGADLLAPDQVRAAEHPDQPVDPGEAVRYCGAGWRREGERHRLGPVTLGHLAHAFRRPRQSLAPADSNPAGVGIALGPRASHRVEQPIRGIDQLGGRATLDAQVRAGRVRGIGLHGHQRAVLHDRDAAATRAAQRAEARDALDRHPPSSMSSQPRGVTVACSPSRSSTVVVADSNTAGPFT
jgi:hypothetical protein